MKTLSIYLRLFAVLILTAGYFNNSFSQTKDIQNTNELVKVIPPKMGKLTAIDDKTVKGLKPVYITPGSHKFTFSIEFGSVIFCPDHSFTKFEGSYDLTVSADKGQTVEFIFKDCPRCKHELAEFYDVLITPKPLKEGMARVYFKRQNATLGKIVSHLVIDRGDSSSFNACVFQKKDFPIDSYDFDKAWNASVYINFNDTTCLHFAGQQKNHIKHFYFDNTLKLTDVLNFDESNMCSIQGSVMKYLIKEYFKFISTSYAITDSLKSNARIVAIIGSGDSFFWDRPAGYLKLEEITPGGDQAFAKPIYVEAGKTYYISYDYPGAKFEFGNIADFESE